LKDYELACAYTFLTVCGEQLDKKSMQSVTRQELMKEHFRRLNFFAFHQPKRFCAARDKQKLPPASGSSWVEPSSYNYHFQLGDIYPFSYKKLDMGCKDTDLLNDIQSLIKRRDQWMNRIETDVITQLQNQTVKSR